ncbi:MAG: nucleotidyltransferase domain-containing protein [Chloroflexi bacterium]|nr:nucleotidyltransferase domain-containing protein [Chloroflexota bacterium]
MEEHNLDAQWAALAASVRDRDKDVVAAYLFGSRARGTADALSDVDIAVLLRDGGNNQEWLWAVEDELAVAVCDVLQSSDVDLVVLNTAPLPFQFEVIAAGELLLSNDEAARTDFEVAVMTRYWDFKKYDEEYDRYLLARIKERFSDVERQEYHAALDKVG